jgi:hypothetical protein
MRNLKGYIKAEIAMAEFERKERMAEYALFKYGEGGTVANRVGTEECQCFNMRYDKNLLERLAQAVKDSKEKMSDVNHVPKENISKENISKENISNEKVVFLGYLHKCEVDELFERLHKDCTAKYDNFYFHKDLLWNKEQNEEKSHVNNKSSKNLADTGTQKRGRGFRFGFGSCFGDESAVLKMPKKQDSGLTKTL